MKKTIFLLLCALLLNSPYLAQSNSSNSSCKTPEALVRSLLVIQDDRFVLLDDLVYGAPFKPEYQVTQELAAMLAAVNKAQNYPVEESFWGQSDDELITGIKIVAVKQLYHTTLLTTKLTYLDASSHEIIWRFALNNQNSCWEIDDLISKKTGSLKNSRRTLLLPNN